jgi:hypothetical protein
MQGILRFAAVAGFLLLGAESVQLVERLVESNDPAVVRLNIQRNRAVDPDVWAKVKRGESTIDAVLYNEVSYELTVAQYLILQRDR